MAAAHLFAQARRDSLQRLASTERLVIDAEPGQLSEALIDRYFSVKKAGSL
ncbi:hypothetical protein [Bordetella genomosp. 13]|uniref:hypothetical protein n=1 Tax=Bordetella genomosp. 13 TaxID=463040 RepID=UPI0012FC82AC|nr:hypothetical protein [Bordetella genomosp. 13]